MYRGKRGKCSKYARRRIILLIATLLFIISIYFIFTKVYLPKIAKKDNMNFNNDNINNNVDNNPRIDNNIKQKNIIDEHAKKKGYKSLNSFVVDAINEKLEK